MTNDPGSGSGDTEFRRRLSAEVRDWAADGVISAEQAESILRRYPVAPTDEAPAESSRTASVRPDAGSGRAADGSTIVGRAVSIIGVMGAVLVGLGIIIYVAANWDVIPVWARIAMLVAMTSGLNAAGWFLFTRLDYPRMGVAVLVVGALAFGAAIHLVAQIYHVPVNHPNLTTAWFLGVLPVAYLARSRVMVGLSLGLLAMAMGFRTQWWLQYYGEETLLFLAPMTLLTSAALCSLGVLQRRFAWTRPLSPYCYYPGLAAGITAFGVMAVASIWVDVSSLVWTVVSIEYWITAGIAVAVAAVATAGLWRRFGDPDDERQRPIGHTIVVSTMLVAAALMWLWLAFPVPALWWLFTLAALGGVSAVVFVKQSALLLVCVASLLVLLTAIRFVSLVDLEGEAAPILLAAAAIMMATCVFAASVTSPSVPWLAQYARYGAASGLTFAALILHLMGYGSLWRWETPLEWSWMPVEYWAVVGLGWLLAGAAIGFVLWKRGSPVGGDLVWAAAAVAVMATLALGMWLGLAYQASSSWAAFNLALLAGIAALVWYAYVSRQMSVAYLAGFVFAFSVVVRCFVALYILADGGLLLWLGPVVLAMGALVFLTARLRVRWADISKRDVRTNFRAWELTGMLLAIASIYAMSYSDPWAPRPDGNDRSAMTFLGEYWFLAGWVCAAALAVLVAIWVVDRMRLPSMPVPPGQSKWETSAAATMGILIVLAWLGLLLGWTWTWLPFNGALLCMVLGLVAAGYRWNRADLINLAVGVFAITLVTRYFEFGFGLLGQALAFIVAGVIMLVMGFGLEFLRRRMLRGVRPVGATA